MNFLDLIITGTFVAWIGAQDVTVNRAPKADAPDVYEYKVSKQRSLGDFFGVNGLVHLGEDQLHFKAKKEKRGSENRIIRYEDIEEVYPNGYILFVVPVRRFLSQAVTVSLKNGQDIRFIMTKRRLFVKSLQERIEAWNKTPSQADG